MKNTAAPRPRGLICVILFVAAYSWAGPPGQDESVAPVTVTLAWNPVPGAASYTVSYGTQSGVYGLGSATCAAPATAVSISIVPVTNYYFVVNALFSNGLAGPNSAQIAYIAPPQAQPAPPTPPAPSAVDWQKRTGFYAGGKFVRSRNAAAR